MKRFIKSLSIKRKIMFITLGTSCLVVMLVSLSLIINQLSRYRQDLQKNLTIVADMVAFSSAAPLMFSDPKSAAVSLSSLSTNPTILNGHIFTADGELFATYQNPAVQGTSLFLEQVRRSENASQRLALLEGADSFSLWQHSLKMIRPILSDGRRIGFVVLHSSTAPLQRMFLEVVSFSTVTLISALCLLYFIVSYLQNMITRPIVSLARTMQTVSGSKDYSLRVVNDSSDETGQLIDGFNEMLGQIEERDVELGRQRDTLEATVGARTEELRQMVADLEVARDAAEAASRSKSEFLANMSHEIRTPMNGVLGMTELLMGTGLSEKQLRYSRTIYHSGASLLAIINDVLDFSKIEAGKIELESISFDLRTMLDGIVELVSAAASQKGLALNLTIAGDVPKIVCGDPLRVRQVLLNLVSNAVKFTERGHVEVVVDCRDKSATDLEVCFSVRDSGVGIQPEVISKIFESFSQADGSMTRKFGGTGLGLTIAKQLAEMMGGRVTAESSPGIGSCFRFIVRFDCTDVTAAGCLDALEPGVLPEPFSPIDRSTGKKSGAILLVEDNPVNQDVGREMLECLGCRVAVAANGQDALDRLATERFALVLMDCQMPVLDGYSTTRILREQEEAARISDGIDQHQVVIALTGHARLEDRQLCIDSGMDDYLTKPFSIKQMDALLSRWLPHCSADFKDENEPSLSIEVNPGVEATAATFGDSVPLAHADTSLNSYCIDSIRMLDPHNSKQLLQKVVTKFIEETPHVISDIQHAASVCDMDGVFKKAHYLKSSSANLGAVKLAEYCKTLESIGRSNMVIPDVRLISCLEAEFTVVSAALVALLQGESV